MLSKKRTQALLGIIVALCFYMPSMAQWQLTGNRDANTLSLIGTTNGVPLRLGTKNLPRVFIDTTGNVGIGTVNPVSRLDVAGKIKILDGTQGAGKVLTSDTNGLASWLTPTVSPWTVTGNNLSNINTGNVGIGIITPLYKLDVSGDSRINGIKIGKGNSGIADNTAIGNAALDSNTTGSGNTANGFQALKFNTTGLKNTGIGSNALAANKGGIENTATGAGALQLNNSGQKNTATGANALANNAGGVNNTAHGDSALYNNTIGNNNTAFGFNALKTNQTGSSNTAIGYLADVSGNNLTNATAIGANAKVTASNAIVLGSNANVGIGIGSPGAKLDIAGNIKIADGTEATGKVLTSDANGFASWQVAPGSLWTLSGSNAYYSQAGNVGIGNTTPLNKLSVTGSADISGRLGIGTTAPLSKMQVGSKLLDDNGYAYDSNTAQIIHQVPTSSTVLNDPKTVLMLSRQGTGGQTYAAGAAFNLCRYENNSVNSKTRMDIQMANGYFLASPVNVMTLLSNGSVGINNTAPKQALDINGNLQFSNASLPKGFVDETGGTSPLFTMSSNFHDANINTVYRGGAYRIDLRNGFPMHNWFARPANSSTENAIMSLRENGGLSVGSTFTNYAAPANGAIFQGSTGFGTQYPTFSAHVAGDITASTDINDGSAQFAITGTSNQSKRMIMGYDVNGNGYGFIKAANYGVTWTTLALQPNGGAVGINTITPQATLDVYGSTKFSGGDVRLCNSLDNTAGSVGIGTTNYTNVKLAITTNDQYGVYLDDPIITGGNALYLTGSAAKPGGGSWATASDKRLKQAIKKYPKGLDLIQKINPVTYRYNELTGFNTDIEYVGVIAQELQEIAPNMVRTFFNIKDKKEYLSVDNSEMTYTLINAVKELKGQVDTKDATITKQQEQLNALQAQMNTLLQKFDALDSRQQACCNAASVQFKTTEQAATLSSASLDQNIPNPPVNYATRIGYNIPKGATKAELVINDNYGRKIKSVNLSVMGKGILNVDTRELVPGTYSYTLLVDGKMVETKQMVVVN